MPYKIYSADNPIIQRLNPKPFRLNLPRYCEQDITGFYTIDYDINPQQDLTNYCEHTRESCVTETVIDKTNIQIPSFLPTDSALWLDADDSSTLTLVSGAVSEWRDKSGNNRHATQATAGNRPLLVTNGLNGTDVIRFDGSDDFLIHPYTEGSNSTWFVVANKLSTKSGGQGLFFATSPNTVVHNAIWVESSTTSQQWASYAGASFQDSGVIVNTLFQLLCTVSPSGNPIQLFTDGSLSFTTTSSVRYGGDANDRRRIGNEGTTRFSRCDISQIIIFPRVLTQAEREEMEGYMAWSTGLQRNLPVNHPYKDSYTGVTVTGTTTCTDFYLIDTYPDTDISVSVSPSSVLENSGTPLVFTFTLAQAIAHNTTVNYTVSGTATSGVDYSNQTGTATIIAGQTSVNVSITPTGDTNVEPDETMIITIKNATANSQFIAFGSQISATGTITNDDSEVIVNAVVNVSVSPSSVTENAGIPLVFTFSVNNPPAPINSDCTINFTIGGTATAGVDYPSGQPTSIVIPAGQSSATLSITPIGDSLVESNETISVSMQSASATGYSFFFGNSSRTGTITNDD